MQEITLIDFNKNRLAKAVHQGRLWGTTTEKAWFTHDKLLGIVLFDTVDHDWSFVVLHDDDGYRACEVGTSFPDQKAATVALEKVLHRTDS